MVGRETELKFGGRLELVLNSRADSLTKVQDVEVGILLSVDASHDNDCGCVYSGGCVAVTIQWESPFEFRQEFPFLRSNW